MGDRSFFAGGGGNGGGPPEATHRANVFGLGAPGFFSFDDNSAYKVPFDNMFEDSDDYWSVSDKAFVIPAGLAGFYLVVAQVMWTSNHNALTGGDFRWLDLADKDHGTPGGWWAVPDCKIRPVSDENTIQQLAWCSPLLEGDSVAAFARWGGFTDSVDEDIQSVNTWFSLVKLA